MNQSNPYYSETSVYNFALTLTTPNATALAVNIPTSFTVSNLQCLLNCVVKAASSSNSYTLTISSTSVSLSISVTNPSSFNLSSGFSFKTSSLLGDMDFNSIIPSSACLSPCRSCSNPNISTSCLTCYPWSTLTLLLNGSCLSTCPDTYFPTVSATGFYSCSPCDIKCAICTASPTNCSSCLAQFIYFNSTCLAACPSTYFSTTLSGIITCQLCQTDCLTCTDNTHCTGCSSTTFLLNSSCVSSCPAGTYTLSRVCSSCPLNCLVCSSANGTCTTCQSGFYLYSLACWSVCPSGVYPNITTKVC